MPLLGAHMSIAGGYYKAVRAAADLKMDCVQIFTKNNNQWRGKALTDEDVDLFRAALDETGVRSPCGHDSYLINLASPADELWTKSTDAFVVELERAEKLGLLGLVMHPGSFVDSNEEAGLKRIVSALRIVLDKTDGFSTQIWLENTAGQGSSLGHRLEHLAYLLSELNAGDRVGVCIDTCHIFAAGYKLASATEYEATMGEISRTVGIDRVRAFHLNDSKRELGSRVDRHEHIGEGHLGCDPFKHLLTDARWADRPMYLETPKGERDGESLDAMNLATLRTLARGGSISKERTPTKPKKAAKST